ncbi:caspase family protein [Variovorax sp. YR566]|uniref:caspase family protein n=1 Tax=Variovorax sp. YR566 TaxID=3450237 RepID=UPI003F7E7CAA
MAKLALCIGINNYPGTDMDLAGCVNDANDWAAELEARGFLVEKLVDSQATKARMIAGFRRMIDRAVSGDMVVFTYSGHGTYQYDTDGDEADGLDEALCPHDVHTIDAALTDDEIHTLFMARKAGVHIALISDSCNSGTVNRDALNVGGADRAGRVPRYMPMENWMSPARLAADGPRGGAVPASAVHGAQTPLMDAIADDASDVLMAGCEEGEGHFSYDAVFMGRPNGAFTFYALKALRTLTPGASYADWHEALKDSLPSPRYPQTPQIQGGDDARKRPVFS